MSNKRVMIQAPSGQQPVCKINFSPSHLKSNPPTVVCFFVTSDAKVLYVKGQNKNEPLIVGINLDGNLSQEDIQQKINSWRGFGPTLVNKYWYTGLVLNCHGPVESVHTYIDENVQNRVFIAYILVGNDNGNELIKLGDFIKNSGALMKLGLASGWIDDLRFKDYDTLLNELPDVCKHKFPSKPSLESYIASKKRTAQIIATGILGGTALTASAITAFAKYGDDPRLWKFLDRAESLGERGLKIKERYDTITQTEEDRINEELNIGQYHLSEQLHQHSDDQTALKQKIKAEQMVKGTKPAQKFSLANMQKEPDTGGGFGTLPTWSSAPKFAKPKEEEEETQPKAAVGFKLPTPAKTKRARKSRQKTQDSSAWLTGSSFGSFE